MHIIFIALFVCASVSARRPHLMSGKELVDHLNAHQKHFKAKLSKLSAGAMEAKAMHPRYRKQPNVPTPAPPVPQQTVTVPPAPAPVTGAIPQSFDARSKWPSCPTIGTIYDQSSCGSCWAFAPATSTSDRYCIASNSTFVFSPADILSCCSDCYTGNGCDGGYPQEAFDYIVNTGVCSGGVYDSSGDCKPYPFAPCSDDCPSQEPPTPACQSQCQAGYSVSYTQDRHFASTSYSISSTQSAIQTEIMTYGPVATCFDLYEDFYHYSSGVYKYTAGPYIGGHCVKVLGWGVQNGTDYWLAANQWNTSFGENGYFLIAVGDNGVDFEDQMMAAHPKV